MITYEPHGKLVGLKEGTPEWMRAAKDELGLSASELGRMLEVGADGWRKWAMPEDKSQHRSPGVRVVALLKAYLAGYRPEGWPPGK
ncbi:MAG: hypothetical protein AAGM38_13255 [Pseudomonadota bacterium]